MALTAEEIGKLAQGYKLKKKAVRGHAAGSLHNLDMLAGACAVLCQNSPDRMTISIAFTKLIEAGIPKKFGKNVSRAMISARFNKLYDIGFIQKRKEEIIIQGRVDRERNVFYIGDPDVAPISEGEKELTLTGKFTKKWWDRQWRNAHTRFKPLNRFEEALFDLISDNSLTSFPATMEEYREACNHAFKEELAREDRVDQMIEWAITAYVREIDILAAREDPIKFIVIHAKVYTAPIWTFVQKQMAAFQSMAQSGMKFNKDEYDKLVAKNPDFYKTVKEMKEEGKL